MEPLAIAVPSGRPREQVFRACFHAAWSSEKVLACHQSADRRQAPGGHAADPPSPRTRTLADLPIGGLDYRQISRLAKILIGDATHAHRESHSARMLDPDHRGE
jgi:hypothetical protein